MRQHSGALCRTLKTDICRDLNGVGNLRYSRGRAVSQNLTRTLLDEFSTISQWMFMK